MALLRIVARRAARALATLVALAVAAWLCLEAAPGEPREAAARAAGLLPGDATRVEPGARERILAGVAARHGLDGSAAARFGRFAGGLARGDLGRSWRDGRPVTARLARALPVTLALLATGLAVAYALGTAGALFGASRPRGARDRVVGVLVAAGMAMPIAWASVLALRTFAAGRPWAWFPPRGGGWVLPLACLTYVAAALIARHGRAALVAAMGEPFVLAARARGVPGSRLLTHHALGVANAPLASLLVTVVPHLLGASIVVERAFDLRGLGALLLDASQAGDAPVVIGATLAAGLVVALASIAADALAAVADPRLAEAG